MNMYVSHVNFKLEYMAYMFPIETNSAIRSYDVSFGKHNVSPGNMHAHLWSVLRNVQWSLYQSFINTKTNCFPDNYCVLGKQVNEEVYVDSCGNKLNWTLDIFCFQRGKERQLVW